MTCAVFSLDFDCLLGFGYCWFPAICAVLLRCWWYGLIYFLMLVWFVVTVCIGYCRTGVRLFGLVL